VRFADRVSYGSIAVRLKDPWPFIEGEAPVDLLALWTFKGLMLEATDRQGLVLDHLYQGHLCPARQTPHRTSSGGENPRFRDTLRTRAHLVDCPLDQIGQIAPIEINGVLFAAVSSKLMTLSRCCPDMMPL